MVEAPVFMFLILLFGLGISPPELSFGPGPPLFNLSFPPFTSCRVSLLFQVAEETLRSLPFWNALRLDSEGVAPTLVTPSGNRLHIPENELLDFALLEASSIRRINTPFSSVSEPRSFVSEICLSLQYVSPRETLSL